MKWPGEETLILKKGCREMLVWNKTDTLKKGSIGVFKGVAREDAMLEVFFEEEGTVLIQRETWMNRDRKGERIGSV